MKESTTKVSAETTIYNGEGYRIIRNDHDCWKKCGNQRSVLLARINNPNTKTVEHFTAQACECQRTTIETMTNQNGEKGTYFTPEAITEMIKAFASGRYTKRTLSEHMEQQFNIPAGKPRDDKFEWTSPTTKKIENMRSGKIPPQWHKIFELATPYDSSIRGCAAAAAMRRTEHNPKMWKAFRPGTGTATISDYDSTPCPCGHEKGAHNDRGQCTLCKQYCE